MLMSVSGRLGSVLLVRGSSGELTRFPVAGAGAWGRSQGGISPVGFGDAGSGPAGELAISFLPLTVEHEGKSNAVSCVTVKNTR